MSSTFQVGYILANILKYEISQLKKEIINILLDLKTSNGSMG